MSSHDDARSTPDPSDSVLFTLARIAMAPDADPGDVTWPRLDLDDPDQRRFGDYELLEEIDRGGMGVVYRARQRSLDREVAIKFIAAGIADAPSVERFLAEARVAARLLHPNIVPVHEVGSIDGLHYFSMPLVKGRTLAGVLASECLSTQAALALLLKLCDAIDYAHRLGLLHLDLKPANVLLDERGEPLVTDFGLARHVDENGGVDAQEVSGTPMFMAPEQILIRQYRLTRATDIYALGAILYRCLTGVSPHGEGSADDLIRRAAAGRVRPPREIDPGVARDLEAVCMKCLELQPADRYAGVAALADDLRRVRDGLPVAVRRPRLGERMQRWFRREPRLAAAMTAALLALLAGAVATTWQWHQAATERDRAQIAGDIGAHLFAYEGDDSKRADDLIAWLGKRLPGDQDRQADALAAFAGAVNRESDTAASNLLSKVVVVLGGGYRTQMIHSLLAGSDPHRHLYAALLAFNDAEQSGSPGAFEAALQAALAEQPDDPLTWQVAAIYCPGTDATPACARRKQRATEHLVHLDPTNMYAWLLAALHATDPQRRREALHQAARRSRYDDYVAATYAAYARAVKAAAVPVPPLLARPLRIVAPQDRVEAGIAMHEAEQFPIAFYRPLLDQCGVNVAMPVSDPSILADCRAVGETMMRSDGGLLSRMIGAAVVKTVARGEPAATQATQVRRLYVYLEEVTRKLTPGLRMHYPPTRWLHDIASAGEMVAFQRRARFFGFPDRPPAGWQPADPADLMSARERHDTAVALDSEAAALVAGSRYAEAIAALAPREAMMRRNFAHDWLLARYLTTLGRARLGQHQFVAAESALREGWDIVADFGPDSTYAKASAQAMVDLYAAWNTAEPGAGHDLKQSQWRQTLAALDAGKAD